MLHMTKPFKCDLHLEQDLESDFIFLTESNHIIQPNLSADILIVN